MTELTTKVRSWGNSFGVIIPHEIMRSKGISEGEEVSVILVKKDNILKETFGKHKFSKPVQKLMKEMDKELYDI